MFAILNIFYLCIYVIHSQRNSYHVCFKHSIFFLYLPFQCSSLLRQFHASILDLFPAVWRISSRFHLVIQFIGEKFSLLFVFWSKFIFISSLFKGTFLVTEFYLEVVVFSVITLKILFHYFLAFIVCVEKLPALIDIWGKHVIFPLTAIKTFSSFSLRFLHFDYKVPRCNFLCIEFLEVL